MKAVILVGGYGKRLRPLTDTIPKPLLPVAGKPILDWQLDWLKANGIRSVILLTGYLHDGLIKKARQLCKKKGIEMKYTVEKIPLGTGGALKLAEKLLENEKEFLLINGDIITNMSIKRLSLGNNVAAMALVPLRTSYGVAELKGDKIIGFKEKPVLKDHWINAGVYLLSNDIFDYVPTKGDLEKTAFAELSWNKLLKGVRLDGVYWRSIDSHKDLEEVSKDLKKISVTNVH
ncbi:MAG: nucleotidyltransferase family protein [Candidatus Micrarchaeia archaeon]